MRPFFVWFFFCEKRLITMDNSKILLYAKKEFTIILCDLLTEEIFKGVNSLWIKAKDEAKQGRRVGETYVIFQKKLGNISKWNSINIENEYNRIIADSAKTNEENFNTLLKKLFLINTQLLASVNNSDSKKIKVKVPTGEKFIHQCYIECSHMFYENALLMEDRPDRITVKEHYSNFCRSLKLISDCIENSIRKMLPLEDILRDVATADEAAEKKDSEITKAEFMDFIDPSNDPHLRKEEELAGRGRDETRSESRHRDEIRSESRHRDEIRSESRHRDETMHPPSHAARYDPPPLPSPKVEEPHDTASPLLIPEQQIHEEQPRPPVLTREEQPKDEPRPASPFLVHETFPPAVPREESFVPITPVAQRGGGRSSPFTPNKGDEEETKMIDLSDVVTKGRKKRDFADIEVRTVDEDAPGITMMKNFQRESNKIDLDVLSKDDFPGILAPKRENAQQQPATAVTLNTLNTDSLLKNLAPHKQQDNLFDEKFFADIP